MGNKEATLKTLEASRGKYSRLKSKKRWRTKNIPPYDNLITRTAGQKERRDPATEDARLPSERAYNYSSRTAQEEFNANASVCLPSIFSAAFRKLS